jgi:arylsulfatase A
MKHYLKLCVVTFTSLLIVFANTTTVARDKSESPNIVIILADDMGLGDVRAYTSRPSTPKDSPVETPSIDSIAKQGMLFMNAHSSSAVCSPTRYALLTGRYAWRTRLKGSVVLSHERALIEPERVTIAELLRERGYTTAIFGKWHLGLNWQTFDGEPAESDGLNVDYSKPFSGGPVDHGFDMYFGDDTINWPPYTYIENNRTVGIPVEPVYDNHSWPRVGEPFHGLRTPGYEQEDVLPEITRRTVQYIKEHSQSKKPFFVYMPLTAPHEPIVPPDRIAADRKLEMSSFKRDPKVTQYDNLVRVIDWSVGQVLNALESQGISDNTLVVFSADNGFAKRYATHHDISPGFVNGALLRGQKGDIHEGGHRVPLVVRWPGNVPQGATSDALVELNDIYATVADILQVSLEDDMAEDSISMLPLLLRQNSAKGSSMKRHTGINHSAMGGFAIRDIDVKGTEWKLVFGEGAAKGFSGGMKINPFTKIREHFDFSTHLQLYDMTNDPGENYNLLSDGATPEEYQRVLKLQSKLQKIIAIGRSR